MRELAYFVNRTLAEIIAKRHIDFVGTVDKLLYHLLVRDAESSCCPGKGIELFARGAGIHTFEVLVHLVHLLSRLPRIFAHICHRLLHVGIILDALANGGCHTAQSVKTRL